MPVVTPTTPPAPPRPHRGVFGGLATMAASRPRRVLLVWALVALAAAPLAVTVSSALSGAGWDAQGSEAQEVRHELRRDFPALGAEAAVVVYHQEDPVAADPGGLSRVVAALGDAPAAASVVDPRSMPPEAGLVARDGRTALVPVELAADEDADRPEAAGELTRYVEELDLPAGASADVTGEWPVWSDFNDTNAEALHDAELLSGIPSVVLLVVAFGGAVAAGLPLALALAGIAVGFGALHVLTAVTPLSVWSMNFSMMIGLAVGIDYSLFIVSRYREERAGGADLHRGIATTLETAGKAVFLSALTVVLSLSAIYLVPVMVFRSMALGMILAVVAVAAASLTLLPALLALLGDRVLVTRGAQDPDVADEGRWARLADRTLGRPVRYLVAGVVLLAAIAAPAAGMRLGMPGARVVDEGRSSRDGYEHLVEAFGPGAAAPVFVTVAADEAQRVVATARADDAVVDARLAAPPAATGRAAVRVVGAAAVDDPGTGRLVERLRDRLATEAPSAKVGGPAAQNADLTDVLTGRAPVAIGLILVIAFALLLVVFRSLLIAVTSVLMNLLTVGAAFGFATVVFQHGVGAGLVGVDSQGFVDAWAPFFFFALLFGLSMDYQLFLLASIRERYEATGDTRSAVRDGIALTGRPITNAAAIMIVVFVAFGITGPIPPTELGITLAVAVLLDATVVRMLLVPTVIGLLGARSWYLPGWLDRRLPHVRFSH
ncbi:MAG TPA: MMPL family transporter [Acidimicrobiales bacterium]|nr:MMPL family transporter [Acidimicrobiales bacterium]